MPRAKGGDGGSERCFPKASQLASVFKATTRGDGLHSPLRIVHEIASDLELHFRCELLGRDTRGARKHPSEVARAHGCNLGQLTEPWPQRRVLDDVILNVVDAGVEMRAVIDVNAELLTLAAAA